MKFIKWNTVYNLKPDQFIFKGSSLNRKRVNNPYVQTAQSVREQKTKQYEINGLFPREKKFRSKEFTKTSKTNLRKRIFALSTLGNPLYFHTLTFVNDTTEKQASLALNRFLTVLRKKDSVNYIWVAEYQPGSRRPHYHVLFDKFYDVRNMNRLWLKAQYTGGIIYPNESEHYNMNPYHVNKDKTQYWAAAYKYFSKYFSKSEYSNEARKWGCNRAVSALFTTMPISDSDLTDLTNDMDFEPVTYQINDFSINTIKLNKTVNYESLRLINNFILANYRNRVLCAEFLNNFYYSSLQKKNIPGVNLLNNSTC